MMPRDLLSGVKSSLVALTLVSLLALAGCAGGDDTGDGSGTPDQSASSAVEESASPEDGGIPLCSEVWVEGQTLPADYGLLCHNGQSVEAAVTFPCGDGGGDLTGYLDRFWARLGGEIYDAGARDAMPENPDYKADFFACTDA